MALGFGSKVDDVVGLIAKKNYAKAIEVLRTQVEADRRDPRLRLQLADVLVMAGKGRDAVGILTPLADEYARDGFAAKAIAVLKKIQKIDPGRRDVDSRLASLIQEKQRVAVASVPSTDFPEIGMEEIGLDFSGGSVAVPAAVPAPPPEPAPIASPEPVPAEPEIGLEAAPEIGVEATPEISLEAAPEISLEVAPEVPLDPPVATPPVRRPVSVIEDPDMLFMEEMAETDGLGTGEVEVEPVVEVEPEPSSGDPMTDSRFAEELQALVDVAFLGPSAEEAAPPAPAEKGGSQIVVSPLFRDFSVDEMVAVIQGLNLLTFERGDVILREGQPGDSLYMLTSGMVRAFRKDSTTGRQVKIADLTEGAFFGEVSILTGGPRTATVAALTRCELLELDRPTLDGIRKTNPHVWDVLEDFARQRSARRSG